jgi:hypothetical protein
MMSPHLEPEYPPLVSSGFHDIREDDLERTFADPFAAGRGRRNELCGKLRAWLNAVKSVGIPLEVWVDGSFATWKPAPNDVDILCVVDFDLLCALTPEALERFHELFMRDAVKSEYECHVFGIPRGDQERYDEWFDFFGHSRNKMPKGIVRFFLEGRTNEIYG